MAVVTRAERKRRRCDALARLNTGMGVGEVTEYLVSNYDLTRRSANMDVRWASAQIVAGLKEYNRPDLLAWLLTQSERVYQRSLESGQYSSAIGSLRLIYEMALKDPEKVQKNKWHGNYKH